MEFIEGQTLKQYLTGLGRPMLLGDVVMLLAPVAESLERVHAAKLLHRDISPDNIMITDSGAAKLLDFGAARAFSLRHAGVHPGPLAGERHPSAPQRPGTGHQPRRGGRHPEGHGGGA